MDTDGTNEVGIEEFVTGCMRLKGEAKSIDVNMLLYKTDLANKHFVRLATKVDEIYHLAKATHATRHASHTSAVSQMPSGDTL